VTRESRWDQDSRNWEIAYTAHLDGLCECGVPREVCMDPDRAWLVDHRVGYRCRAMETVQRMKSDEDARVEQAGGKTYPSARKWYATEHREGLPDGRQDSHSPVHS
jgi:hypothetical protein